VRRLFLLLVVAAAVTAPAVAAPADAKCALHNPASYSATPPPLTALTGRVVDNAHILSAAERRRLTLQLAALERRTTDQLVVVTLPSLGGYSIEQVGLRLGKGWGIGQSGLDNGVLLIVAPNDRQVRIEVGCGLEGLLTDKRAGEIIQQKLIPLLRTGGYDRAAESGATAIAAILEADPRRPQPRRGDGT
jgi:uncharacterized protein